MESTAETNDDVLRSGIAARGVTLVHDYLLVMRGAERSFLSLCDLWPDAPVASLLYDGDVFGARLTGHPIRTSSLQRLGLSQTNFKALLPLLPLAANRLDVSNSGVVVSSSSAFAHGVRPDVGAAHICYCYTPFRYAWYEQQAAIQSVPRPLQPAVGYTLKRIRAWDVRAASRGTTYIAISRISQERIERFWGVNAPIVYPPVELARFVPGVREDFLLVVCELVRHKQIDLALEAAKRACVPIKVVGGGIDEPRLRAQYGDTAEFLGRVGDEELAQLYARARALVVPNTEEFGITAVEAQASGTPVVAAAAGGALETVLEGVTGFFFPSGDVDALTEILTDPCVDRIDSSAGPKNAARFSATRFQQSMVTHIAMAVGLPVASEQTVTNDSAPGPADS